MKYKLLLITSFIAVFTFFDFVDSSDSLFTKLLKKGLRNLELNGGEDLTIISGISGTGKTTLARYLTNDIHLIKAVAHEDRCIFVGNGIGNKSPQTALATIPIAMKDLKTGTRLIDLPALNKIWKTSADDIAAKFFMQKVFESAGRVKLLIVEEFSSLTYSQTDDKFLLTLEHVAKLIPDVTPLAGSIGLVVTKVDSTYDDKDIIKSIQDFINFVLVDLRQHLQTLSKYENTGESQSVIRSQILLADMILNSENIHLFKVPCKNTSTDGLITCDKCHSPNDLRTLVYDDLKFSMSNVSFYQMTTSNASQQFAKENLTPASEKDVDEKLDLISTEKLHLLDSALSSGMFTHDGKIQYVQRESSDIQKFLQELCRRNTSAQMLLNKNWRNVSGNTLKDLDFDLDLLQFLYTSTDQDVNEKLKNCSVMQKAKVAQKSYFLIDELKSEVRSSNCTEFSPSNDIIAKKDKSIQTPSTTFAGTADLNETKAVDCQKASSKCIPSTHAILNTGSYHRQANYLEKDVLYVTGEIVFLSSITGDDFKGAKRLLYVLASKEIFVDKNLSLEDTHIVLRAPVIEVVGNVRFKMSGINGSAQGEHGISPGSVTVAAETIRNGANLIIQSQGGNGVQGGKGPDGADGNEPTLGYSIRDILWYLRENNFDSDKCNQKYPGREFKLLKYDSKNSITAEAYARDGRAPGNGGRGKDGGRGGKSGAVSVKVTTGTLPQVTQTDGRSGNGGAGGSPGSRVCTQKKFIIKCDVYMWPRENKMDTCRFTGNDCIYYSTGVHGSPGGTPNAVLNYKYPGPDVNSDNVARTYLLRSLNAD